MVQWTADLSDTTTAAEWEIYLVANSVAWKALWLAVCLVVYMVAK